MKNTDTDLTKALSRLIISLDRIAPPIRHLIWRSFLQGLFTALGATIGLSLIWGILTFLLRPFEGILPLQ